MRPANRNRILLAAALAVVLFFAFNVILERLGAGLKIDLTEDRLYTISESTKKVLKGLEDPLDATFFFSEEAARDYPQLFAYGRRIRDLLREYQALSGGRLTVRFVNPEPFSPEEDEAVGAGLQGVPTPDGRKIYLGLVVRDTTDRQAVIPFFNQEREDLLEYDLTKVIANVAAGERPTVALLTALPMKPKGLPGFGQDSDPGWAIYDQLRQFFIVENLSPGFRKIPEGTDVLVIVHPPKLDDDQLYLIDQFVLKGGRAVVFVDPFSEASVNRTSPSPSAFVPLSSDKVLDRLFAKWGVEIVPGRILADRGLAQRVNVGGFGPDSIKDYPLWLRVDAAHLDRDDPVTANLETVNMASVGAIRPRDGAKTTIEPLVRSSADSALVDASLGRGVPDIDGFWKDFAADEKTYDLVVRVNGVVESAFPDGPPGLSDDGKAAADDGAQGDAGDAEGASDADETKKTLQAAHLAKSEGPVHLIVGADSDLFDDRFWVRVQDFMGRRVFVPMADNASLLANAIDNLAGSDALISLRGRGVRERPFVVVERLRRRAEDRLLEKERQLEQELERTQQRLDELESKKPEGGGVLTPAQEEEIERFRTRVLEIRHQLRAVQRELVADIERLKTVLAVVNILLVPLLLVIGSLALAWLRRRRRPERAS